MPEITIKAVYKVIDGWYSDGSEYALVEMKIGATEPELILFEYKNA